MKKVLVAMTLAILSFAGIARAECSNKSVSNEMSRIDIVSNEWGQMFIVVLLKDDEGEPVCKTNISVISVRNKTAGEKRDETLTPDNIFPEEEATDSRGKAVFFLRSELPDLPTETDLSIFFSEAESKIALNYNDD